MVSDTSLYEDDSISFLIQASDVDGDSLYFYNYLSQFGYSSFNNNMLTINPEKDFFGTLYDTIVVSDGALLDSSIYSIDIIPVNDTPIISELNDTTMLEDSNLILELHTSDVDGDTLSYEIWSDEDFAIFQLDTNYTTYYNYIDTLTITPYANWYAEFM